MGYLAFLFTGVIDSQRLIVGLLSQKLRMNSILLLVSSEKLIVGFSKSEAQREQRLSSNRERIAAYRSSINAEERQQIRVIDRINEANRGSAARQSVHDL